MANHHSGRRGGQSKRNKSNLEILADLYRLIWRLYG